jgi:hypothetical protein
MGSEDTVDDYANWLAGHSLRTLENLGSKPPSGDLTVFARGKAIPTSQKWLFIGEKNVTCISHGRVGATDGVGSGHCPSASFCIRAGIISSRLTLSGVRACAGMASIAAKVIVIKIRIALKRRDCGRQPWLGLDRQPDSSNAH